MSENFARNLKIVTGIHVAVIVALFASGWLRSCLKPKKETVIPMEFLVEVPPSDPAPPVRDVPSQPAAPKPPNNTPPKPPRRNTIEKSTKRVSNPNRKPIKPLTPEEIQKMLAKGAKPADRTVIPDDDSIHFALVRQAFHDAWAQPSAAEAGDAIVEAEIRLAKDGTVAAARIVMASGVDVMDDSVARALKYVKRVSGLTRDFISRHDTITISFRVE